MQRFGGRWGPLESEDLVLPEEGQKRFFMQERHTKRSGPPISPEKEFSFDLPQSLALEATLQKDMGVGQASVYKGQRPAVA